jgi:hypothetical protein
MRSESGIATVYRVRRFMGRLIQFVAVEVPSRGHERVTVHKSPVTTQSRPNKSGQRLKFPGPRTQAGKQGSSLNALRHGLTGQTVVLPSDDLAAYQRHCKDFPKNKPEIQPGQMLADLSWRLNRITAIETNLLAIAHLIMYEHRLSTRFQKMLKRLQEIQAVRAPQESSIRPTDGGFVFSKPISRPASSVATAKIKRIEQLRKPDRADVRLREPQPP